ncbi:MULTISPECIES: TMEM165/GDT1 family protein [unclassified Nodularia (in: cyanobacteria)]|uniref:TMEM165/GDT1 family protein n=1 Tax=unclassified Nodularia (in: cyanobacteria) TaxID=2656917 RepID=UPI001881FFC9|nr:TMEM165/GDT1 family protein [Nodularia sp. LEGE 06071]MBE9199123.1 TMEM165/GDT1 family protein [Nodularia sp. LEGE 06071]MCC2694665.1 TMEM165/GDT1 family protein [Nodularia sp. LEGE 04288]
MNLDSVPVTFSVTSETENQPEIKDCNESNLTAAIIEPLQPVVTDSQKKQESVAAIFGTTFITIFLAEIGDKTQLSTLLMSAESHAPWVVFIGSGAALITTSLLGVLLGGWMANRLSPKTVEKSAGMMLLLISLMLFWDVIRNS